MNKRFSTILLVISLALNAGIIGGLVVYGIFFINHNQHFNEMPMDNPSSEMGRFDRHMIENDSIRVLRDAFDNTRKDLMQELAKDPLNEARVHIIINESIAAQNKLERAMGIQLIELRKTLSAAEAKDMFSARLDRMNERHDRMNDRMNDRHDRRHQRRNNQ